MKRICLLTLPLLLVACRSVGTTYTRPAQALPQAYSAPGGTVALAPVWWKALGDAHLDALVQKALTQSPSLQIAEARLRQARAFQGIQDASGGLNVGLGASVSRDRISLNGEQLAFMPNRNLNPNMTNHQIGFDASWELDFFGHNRRLAEGAQARTQASAERLRDASLILAAEVARAYVDLRTAQQRLRVAEESLETHQETVRLTELVVRTGEGTQVDLQRVQGNRSAFEATLADLRLELRQQLATLAALTDTPIQDLERDLRDPISLMAVPPGPRSGTALGAPGAPPRCARGRARLGRRLGGCGGRESGSLSPLLPGGQWWLVLHPVRHPLGQCQPHVERGGLRCTCPSLPRVA